MKKVIIILSVFLFNFSFANDATTESCRKIFAQTKSLTLFLSENLALERKEAFQQELNIVSNQEQLINLSNSYFSPEKAEIFTQSCEKIILEFEALRVSNANIDEIKNGISIVIDEEPRAPCRNLAKYDECMTGTNWGLLYNSAQALGSGISAGLGTAAKSGSPVGGAVVGIGVGILGLYIAADNYGKAQEDCYKKHCEGSGGEGPGMPSGGIPKGDNTPR